MRNNLYNLASAQMEGRLAGSEGGRLAREYILSRFIEAGLMPAINGSYYQPFDVGLGSTINVVGLFPGNDPTLSDQCIVIGAHYDHWGRVSGLIQYGAHDNASGSVALLEVARTLSPLQKQLRRTVVFVAFDAEEQYKLGSQYYVQHPYLPPISNTIYMINLDQMGYLSTQGYLLGSCVTSSARGVELFTQISSKYPAAFPVELGPCFAGSDHDSFGTFGVPNIFITTGTTNTPYHTTYDTANKIDYPGVTDITKIALEMAWEIAQGDELP